MRTEIMRSVGIQTEVAVQQKEICIVIVLMAAESALQAQCSYPRMKGAKIQRCHVARDFRDIVVVALSDGWHVLGSASFVAFYTPDGVNSETVRADEHPIVQQLVRKALLGRLKRLGLPTHRGSRGQSLPARDSEELVRRLVEGAQQSPAR